MNIEQILTAYGAWCNNHQDALGCKSPTAMLMQSAPHQCKDSAVKAAKRSLVAFISDDDALALNLIMSDLRRHSVLLYNIITLVYVWGQSIRWVTDYLNGRSSEKYTRISVGKLLERGHGYIERAMV